MLAWILHPSEIVGNFLIYKKSYKKSYKLFLRVKKKLIDFVESYFLILHPRMMAKPKNWACAGQHPHTALWW